MGAWGSSCPSENSVVAGDGGGGLFDPSTSMRVAQSTGDAGDTAFRFFLALVITGEMTGLLLVGLVWAGSVSAASGPTAYDSNDCINPSRGTLLLLYQGLLGKLLLLLLSQLLLRSLLLPVQVALLLWHAPLLLH